MADQNVNVTDQQKMQIIDLVRNCALLYDKAHPDHFRSNMRNEAWEDIGAQVGLAGKKFHTVSLTDM